MKAYLVLCGYCDEFNVDSVFLDKEKAEEYVKKDKRIPYSVCDTFRIEEVELNPTFSKKIVGIHGYFDKDKDIQNLEINWLKSKDMEELKDFTGEKITFRPSEWVDEVTDFDGIVDVTPCKDLTKCHEYIKDIVTKIYSEQE